LAHTRSNIIYGFTVFILFNVGALIKRNHIPWFLQARLIERASFKEVRNLLLSKNRK